MAHRLIDCGPRKLKLQLPTALKIYHEVAGRLQVNTEHNVLYQPKNLAKLNDKLAFMEESQALVLLP